MRAGSVTQAVTIQYIGKLSLPTPGMALLDYLLYCTASTELYEYPPPGVVLTFNPFTADAERATTSRKHSGGRSIHI